MPSWGSAFPLISRSSLLNPVYASIGPGSSSVMRIGCNPAEASNSG